MTTYRLPAGAVLIDGEALGLMRYTVEVTQRARARNGLPPSRHLAQLAALLAVDGHADSSDDPASEADYVSTEEAADLLGCSTRTARRLAPQLGGQRIAGRWVLDRLAIAEHNQGRAPRVTTPKHPAPLTDTRHLPNVHQKG